MKNYLQKLSKGREKYYAIIFIALLFPIFQNCNQKLQTGLDTNSSSSSSTASTTGSTPSQTTSPTTASVAQRQADCKLLLGKPTITAVASNSLTIFSGLKDTASGQKGTSLNYTINWGITDLAKYKSLDCKALDDLQPNLTILNDASLSITNVIDTVGTNLITPAKTQLQLANAAIATKMTISESIISDNVSQFNLSLMPNPDMERCVQGGFNYQFTVKSRIGDVTVQSSDLQIIKMNLVNTCWSEFRLKDPAGPFSAVGNFGTAVALYGPWSAVVAPTEDIGAVVDAGAVYMYKLEGAGWVQKQKIYLSDSAARDTISSVAIYDQTLILSSTYKNSRGAVYVYKLNNDQWVQIQKLDPVDPQLNQDFGQSIAINNKNIFIGAPKATFAGMANAGQVYIYSYNTSGATYLKTIAGEAANSGFGFSVSADLTHLAVGAPQAIGRESLAPGSVYIFSDSAGAWLKVDKKVGAANGDTFGYAVSIFQNRLVVGSPNKDLQKGRISFYDSLAPGLAAKDVNGTADGMRLGNAVGLSTTGVYASAPLFTTADGQRAGIVNFYLYAGIVKATAELKYRIYATNETANSAFGWSISTSGNYIAVGARIKNDPNDNSGAAYIYEYK